MEKNVHPLQTGRGAKRLCQDCGTRYYDLSRSPVLCPKCGVEFVEAAPLLPPARRKSRGAANAPQETEEAGLSTSLTEPSEYSEQAEDEADEDEESPSEDQ